MQELLYLVPLKKASSRYCFSCSFTLPKAKPAAKLSIFWPFWILLVGKKTIYLYPSRLETKDSATYLLYEPSNFVPTQLWNLPASFPRMKTPLLFFFNTSFILCRLWMVMVSPNLPLLIHPHTLSYSTINSFQSENSDGDSGIRGRAPKRRPSLRRSTSTVPPQWHGGHVGVVEGSQEDLDIWKLMWLLVEPSQKYIYSLRRILHLWNGINK